MWLIYSIERYMTAHQRLLRRSSPEGVCPPFLCGGSLPFVDLFRIWGSWLPFILGAVTSQRYLLLWWRRHTSRMIRYDRRGRRHYHHHYYHQGKPSFASNAPQNLCRWRHVHVDIQMNRWKIIADCFTRGCCPCSTRPYARCLLW